MKGWHGAAVVFSSPRRPSGFALIIVLWALVLLTLVATQLTSTGRAEVRLASNLRGAAVAQAAADGCVYQAIEQILAGVLPWPPDPAPRTWRVPGAVATVRLGSEDGKFDLNSVPVDVLARLLRGIGAGASEAQQLAVDIVLWRFPSAQTEERRRAYLQAGLDYTPPAAPFQSVAELGAVLGMTPGLLQRLGPHVTIYHDGDPDPRLADPVVRTILRERGLIADGAATQTSGPPTGTVIVDVDAEAPGGSRAHRHAIVRIGAASDKGGWKVLVWD